MESTDEDRFPRRRAQGGERPSPHDEFARYSPRLSACIALLRIGSSESVPTAARAFSDRPRSRKHDDRKRVLPEPRRRRPAPGLMPAAQRGVPRSRARRRCHRRSSAGFQSVSIIPMPIRMAERSATSAGLCAGGVQPLSLTPHQEAAVRDRVVGTLAGPRRRSACAASSPPRSNSAQRAITTRPFTSRRLQSTTTRSSRTWHGSPFVRAAWLNCGGCRSMPYAEGLTRATSTVIVDATPALHLHGQHARCRLSSAARYTRPGAATESGGTTPPDAQAPVAPGSRRRPRRGSWLRDHLQLGRALRAADVRGSRDRVPRFAPGRGVDDQDAAAAAGAPGRGVRRPDAPRS